MRKKIIFGQKTRRDDPENDVPQYSVHKRPDELCKTETLSAFFLLNTILGGGN